MDIKDKINSLRKELHEYNYQYYVLDNTAISDYEFDLKLKELQDLENNHPEFYDSNSPTLRVGGEVTKEFQSSIHNNPMFSLDNSYSIDELKDWEKRVKKNIDQSIEYTCELKFDGVSINLLYEEGKLIISKGQNISYDPQLAIDRSLRAIKEKKVRNTGGGDTIVGCDTICVHSDTPNAIEIISSLNKAIKSK